MKTAKAKAEEKRKKPLFVVNNHRVNHGRKTKFAHKRKLTLLTQKTQHKTFEENTTQRLPEAQGQWRQHSVTEKTACAVKKMRRIEIVKWEHQMAGTEATQTGKAARQAQLEIWKKRRPGLVSKAMFRDRRFHPLNLKLEIWPQTRCQNQIQMETTLKLARAWIEHAELWFCGITDKCIMY